MPDLERELTDLGASIAWPETPPHTLWGPHAPKAWGRFRSSRTEGARSWRILAIAAAVLLIVAALLAYTPSRNAIARFLNLHTTVNRVQTLPTPSVPAGQRLGLGTPTTLAEAQSKLAWRIDVPGQLGPPDEVYLALPPTGPSGGEVSLYYKNGPVLVTEARGTVDEQFFGKMIGPGTTIEEVTVNGHRGWWISGAPHTVVFIDEDGNPQFETLRLATNTLLLDDGGTVVRIEGDMTRQQALQVAASL